MSQPIMTNFVRKDRPQPSDPDYVPMSAAYATQRGQRPAPAGETPQQRAQRVARGARRRRRGRDPQAERRRARHRVRHRPRRRRGAVPSVTLSAEHYNMIARLLEAEDRREAARQRARRSFTTTTAATPTTSSPSCRAPTRCCSDEVVMIGAHLDSWHTGVGATDNADGATT